MEGVSQYKENYNEQKTIGRGNFGSAHLVIRKSDNKKYVAKKVLLAGMGEKERIAAKKEVNRHFSWGFNEAIGRVSENTGPPSHYKVHRLVHNREG
jgi:serine/threonine protein kinase